MTASHVTNWFIAPAVLGTVGASYVLKCRMDGRGAVDFRHFVEANSVLWGRLRLHHLLLKLVPFPDAQQCG